MSTETTKQKVDVRDLEKGMYVSELDRPWIESPFIFQGFLITGDNELSQLTQTCKYVYVDIEKSKVEVPHRVVVAPSIKREQFHKKKAPVISIAFENELSRAKSIHTEAIATVSEILLDLRSGKLFKVEHIKNTVIEITGSIMRNPDAMMLLNHIDAKGDKLAKHALNVCILSCALARYMGMEKEELYELGLGALLHDVGETRLPEHILNKQDNYSAEELVLMQNHTTQGAEILSKLKDIPDSVIKIAQSHHERANGSGYPNHLANENIDRLTKIVSITDVYDLVTTGTTREPAVTSTDALKSMYDWRDELFDGALVELFIQSLGIYPIGSTVLLNSGEIGIVISANIEHRLTPTIMLVLDKDQKPYQPVLIINLSQYKKGEDKKYEIKAVVQPEDYGIDKTSYIMRELYMN